MSVLHPDRHSNFGGWPYKALFVEPPVHPVARAHPGILVWLRNRVSRYLAYRRTLRELSRLDDRLLRDIGLQRDEVRAAAATATALAVEVHVSV